MKKNVIYVFAITYNFDHDFVAKKCDTYEEALEMLNEYLDHEVSVIRNECEYEPSVLKWTEDDVTLVYAEGYTTDTMDRNYALEDCGFYRIFEIEY